MPKRHTFMIALAATLAAILPQRTVASDEYANIHSVGIISAVADTVAMKKVTDVSGVSNPPRYLFPISAWHWDEMIAQHIASLISPRFTVKQVTYDPGAFYDLNPHEATDTREERLGKLILALPPENDVDAYIVVLKDYESMDRLNGPWLTGLGALYTTMLFGLNEHTKIYATYEIDVVDAKTGSIINTGRSHIGNGFLDRALPIAAGDKNYWTENGLSAEQERVLKEVLLQLVDKTLPYTLYSANLISEIPSSVADGADSASPSNPPAPSPDKGAETSGGH